MEALTVALGCCGPTAGELEMETLLEASVRELGRGNGERALELAEASNRFVDLVDAFYPRAAAFVPGDATTNVLALEAYLQLHIEEVYAQLPDDAHVIEMRGLLLLREPMVPFSSTLN